MELVRNTHMDMLHNISKSMKDIRSITNKNVRRASTIDPSDNICLLASHESYKPTSERDKELQTYTYQEELSNDIVAVYTTQDSAIVAFRGTASVEEATSTWGFLAQSEANYVGTDHHKNIRQHSDEALQQLEEQGIKFSEITFTGHSKGGADAIIAVNNQAGGHRGDKSPEELIRHLVANCNIPVISAGGVGRKEDIDNMLSYGAAGVSVGSPFIASIEASVTDEYKQACVDYGAEDIVVTERISGTPCTVINTPYVQKIGTKQLG